MKISKWILVLIIIVGAVFLFAEETADNGRPIAIITPASMQIISPAFGNNEKIPSQFTCDAENVNPELIFSDVPANAKSLALICHDPDAPMRGGWTHWIVINMVPSTPGIRENGKPASGLETVTDFGKPGYGGPCPPSGIHRYFFYLYALDTILDLGAGADKAAVESAMNGHILEKAELVGLYKRQ